MPKYGIKLKGTTPITDLPTTLGITAPEFSIKDWEFSGTLESKGEFSADKYCLVLLDLDLADDIKLGPRLSQKERETLAPLVAEAFSGEDITHYFSEMIGSLARSGWTPPVYVTVIASNGMGFWGVFNEGKLGWDFEQFGEHAMDGMMCLPINCIFVSQAGLAARVCLGAKGEEPEIEFSSN
ncbi:hypothetical protein ES708_27275 [subsurface metagenome]